MNSWYVSVFLWDVCFETARCGYIFVLEKAYDTTGKHGIKQDLHDAGLRRQLSEGPKIQGPTMFSCSELSIINKSNFSEAALGVDVNFTKKFFW